MRVLMSVVAMLVLLNAAVFLWPDSTRRAVHVSTPKPDINPQFIRLNKEIEAKYAKSVARAQNVDGICYRLGPFMYQANYELAQAVLFNASVEFTKSKRTSKESNVYRVYLGPYESRPEVSDVRVMLKRKNILDHFVRKVSEQEYVISLGIYTTLESAQDAVVLFDGKLEDVKIQSESLVLPDSFWLHFSLGSQRAIKQQLSDMDWGEQSAKLGEYDCQPN